MANNNKAMREALVYAMAILTSWRRDAPLRAWSEYDEAISRARAALAKPPRNCDVGTAEEWIRRHKNYCGNGRASFACINGPGSECKKCFAKWLKMPYEEGGAK